MIKLDDNLLQELGLASLPPEEKKKLLAHIYETLEMRVGMKLAEQMTDAQLDEFEQFINRNDEAGALRWLETNFPFYKDVVAQEFEKLKNEIKQVAPQILAQASQMQAQGGAPLPPAQQQQPYPQQPYPAGPPPAQQQPYPSPQQLPPQPQHPGSYPQPQQQTPPPPADFQQYQQNRNNPGPDQQQPPQAPPSMPYAA